MDQFLSKSRRKGHIRTQTRGITWVPPQRIDFRSIRTPYPTAVIVAARRKLGGVLYIEEKMDDAAGDAEGFF